MSSRNPATDPRPGDVLRDPREPYARKVLKVQSGRVLSERGANNRGWQNLATWRAWAQKVLTSHKK